MLKILRLPITVSTSLILSLSFFANTGNAQYHPGCYMVNSLGQVVDLNNLCLTQVQSQAPQKAKACQGPFDSDGFPIAFSIELKSLKAAIASAKKRDVYATEEPGVQYAMSEIIKEMPFSERSRMLQQNQRNLFKQLQTTNNSEEAKSIQEKLRANSEELGQDPCFIQLMGALQKKFKQQLLY